MSFESDTEQSDVESIGSRTHICETELGSDEDEEDMYYPDPQSCQSGFVTPGLSFKFLLVLGLAIPRL